MFLINEMRKHITGIILLPGSFSGSMSSPRPQRGPLCIRDDVRKTQIDTMYSKVLEKNSRSKVPS